MLNFSKFCLMFLFCVVPFMRLCVPDFRYCAVGTSSANKLQPKFCGNGNSIKNSGLVCFERLFFLIHHRTDAKTVGGRV